MAVRVQQSRTDVLPLTWEVPAAIASCWLLAAALAVPAGQAVACWTQGLGFAWPSGHLVGSVWGLLCGDPGIGLRLAARELPPPWVTYAGIAVLELLLAAVTAWCALLWWRAVGPGAQHGMARRQQVNTVLGRRNLQRRSSVIRPDLTRTPSVLGRDR